MSAEAPKPVEEPVVAPVETPAATVPETAPAEVVEPAVETPAAEPAKEEAKTEEAAPVKEEVKPIEEGVLGYKGTGLLKSFIFQKKFFWFGTEPVEQKVLASYLRGEKAQDLANVNVAWASETGKGLLFFSKKASEKATPAGIFNLSEVSDITEEGTIAFHFTIGGHKHTFEAVTLGERDNWVAQLKAKAAEAKELAPTVTESEKYKETHAALIKPVVAPVAPKKSVEKAEEKKEEKKEEITTPAIVEPVKEEKKEEKKARKSRSASRKRTSIFGNFGLGKKEEKVESPKEETAATDAAAPVEAAAVPETTEATPVEPAAVEATPASPTEDKKEERPAATKRNSIFGTLQSKFSSHKEKKAEDAPVVPAKDAEPVSENAPVIPAVEASEPLATEVTAAAPVEATTEAPVTNGETKVEEKPTVKSDKRKSSLPWLNKKEKSTPTSDEEADKPKSPFAKLRATVRGKKSDKTEDKPAEAAAPAAETSTEAAPVAATEPATEPAPVVPATTPQVVASA